MVKETTKEYQEDLNRRYIYVGQQLFWDLELATFTDTPELPAFFKLFDTPKENRHFIRISLNVSCSSGVTVSVSPT